MYKKQHFNFLLNLILKSVRLQWNEQLGLLYKYDLFYGDVNFVLTKNKKEVLNFLCLDSTKYLKENYTMDDLIDFISECRFVYLPFIFARNLELTSEMKLFHEAVIYDLDVRLKYRHLPYVEDIRNKFVPYKDTNALIQLLDTSFNRKGKLVKEVSKLNKMTSKETKVFIKNKFNGNLVLQWIPELKSGKEVGNLMGAFKEYVEKETNNSFNSYIKNTDFKTVRSDFIDWYTLVIKELDNEFNKLPI